VVFFVHLGGTGRLFLGNCGRTDGDFCLLGALIGHTGVSFRQTGIFLRRTAGVLRFPGVVARGLSGKSRLFRYLRGFRSVILCGTPCLLRKLAQKRGFPSF
jgi:hypothetical protein